LPVKAERAPHPPLVIAHRGANEGRPELENKLPAFERALALGVDAVECDVHLSADNEPVVIHDETLDRTTTGSGAVNVCTASELRKFGVPTLRELCRLVHGKARLLVEIKSASPPHSNAGTPARAVSSGRGSLAADKSVRVTNVAASPDRVLDVILAEKMEKSVLIFSFHPEYLRPIAILRPDIELAFLLGRFDASVPDLASFIALGRELRATTLAPNRKLCTPRFVRAVHDAGFRVFAWTADSPRQQRALIAAAVDGIITNFPERLKTLP
jgi:glycerophosphoryl diester phosphodiesterase